MFEFTCISRFIKKPNNQPNKNILILSTKIKEITGCKKTECTTQELYYWIISKYGTNIDLNL